MARAAIAAKPAKPVAVRAALLLQQDDLRRQRGAALLDGQGFDNASLIAVEQQLQAIDDAEAEATRRAAEAASAAYAEHVAAVRGRIAEIDAARMAALGKAEQAAIEMVKALAEYRQGCAAMVNEVNSLGPAVPASLLPQAVDRLLGDLIAGALFEIRSDQYSLGLLEWHRPTMGAMADWPAADRAQTAPDIEATLQRNTRHG